VIAFASRHRVTMAAPADQALRVAYETERHPLCWQGARLACLLAIAIVAAFGLLDPLLFPDRLALLLKLRLVWVTTLLLFLYLLRTPFAHRHAVGGSVVVALFLGVMVNVITGLTGGGTSPLYAGVLLVLFGMPLLFPWPPALTCLVSCVSLATYALVTVAATPVSHMLLNNLLFVASAGLIAVVSTAHRERLRWSEFVAVRHRSQFLARMSHELRTPIHVMIGYADILLEEPAETGPETVHQLVARIRSHGVLLHRLISDLLDYAKIEAGKMDVPMEPVAVGQVVEQVAADFRPVAQHKGLSLTTTCPSDVPAILSNRQRLEQILINLVGNAVKFTERGAITIDICAAASGPTDVGPGFTVLGEASGRPAHSRVAGSGIVILVKDTGTGIRDEDLPRLAVDFTQLDEAGSKYGGTGLGLSIATKLAKVIGGRLAVRSRHREGSTFALVLPAGAPEARPVARETSPASGTDATMPDAAPLVPFPSAS
jgi:signal transduction histidine kinase